MIAEEIQAAIKKHLPEMQADELKKFIEQAQLDAKSVVTLKQQLESKEDQVKKLLDQKKLFDEATDRLEKAKLSEQATAQKEARIESDGIKTQLAAETRITKNLMDVLSLISKNPRAIEIMAHNESQVQPMYYAGNNPVYPPNIAKTELKKTEVVLTKESVSPEPMG